MAQGDLTIFQEALVAMLENDVNGHQIDFETGTFKVGLTSSTPTAADATPVWGDYTEVNNPDTGTYATGGQAISGPVGDEASGTYTWNDDDTNISWAQHASNPTNALFAVIYATDTTIEHAIAFIDLGGTFDMTTGPLTINFASTGIIKFAIQASV